MNVLFRFVSFWFGFPSLLRTLPGLSRIVLGTNSPRNYLIVSTALERIIKISPIEPENTLDTYLSTFPGSTNNRTPRNRYITGMKIKQTNAFVDNSEIY